MALKLIKFLSITIIALYSNLAFAQDVADATHIEIVFFAHKNSKYLQAEEWPKFVGNLDNKNAVTPTLLEKNNMLLNSEAAILKKSNDYRIIEQVSWLQPITANSKALPFFIQAGKDHKEIAAVVAVKQMRNQYELSLDLIYTMPDDGREFRVTRDIKLKKNEIFYLDHPLLGALIVVSPHQS